MYDYDSLTKQFVKEFRDNKEIRIMLPFLREFETKSWNFWLNNFYFKQSSTWIWNLTILCTSRTKKQVTRCWRSSTSGAASSSTRRRERQRRVPVWWQMCAEDGTRCGAMTGTRRRSRPYPAARGPRKTRSWSTQ